MAPRNSVPPLTNIVKDGKWRLLMRDFILIPIRVSGITHDNSETTARRAGPCGMLSRCQVASHSTAQSAGPGTRTGSQPDPEDCGRADRTDRAMTMSNLRLRHPGTADRTPVAALILTRRGTREWFRAFSRAAGTRSSANGSLLASLFPENINDFCNKISAGLLPKPAKADVSAPRPRLQLGGCPMYQSTVIPDTISG